MLTLVRTYDLSLLLVYLKSLWHGERGQKAQAEKIEKLETQIGIIVEQMNAGELIRRE